MRQHNIELDNPNHPAKSVADSSRVPASCLERQYLAVFYFVDHIQNLAERTDRKARHYRNGFQNLLLSDFFGCPICDLDEFRVICEAEMAPVFGEDVQHPGLLCHENVPRHTVTHIHAFARVHPKAIQHDLKTTRIGLANCWINFYFYWNTSFIF